MGNEKTTKAKKIVGIVANVLVWIFLAFSMLITILVFTAQGSEDGVPSIFGRSLITIETESMEPTYKVGDLVFMKKISAEDKAALEKDTIITYRAPIDINGDGIKGDINTHRIVSVDPATGIVVTQGDHNLITDAEGDNAYTIHLNDIIGTCTEKELTVALKERLPRYMIPNKLIRLETMPLTANGKLNRVELTKNFENNIY